LGVPPVTNREPQGKRATKKLCPFSVVLLPKNYYQKKFYGSRKNFRRRNLLRFNHVKYTMTNRQQRGKKISTCRLRALLKNIQGPIEEMTGGGWTAEECLVGGRMERKSLGQAQMSRRMQLLEPRYSRRVVSRQEGDFKVDPERGGSSFRATEITHKRKRGFRTAPSWGGGG